MIYILMIWTAVAASDAKGSDMKVYYDWRSLGEFYQSLERDGSSFKKYKSALEMCETAASQLGIKSDKYRCVRSR